MVIIIIVRYVTILTFVKVRHLWIGTQNCVLPDVTIGDNSIIGAGSVVDKGVPAGLLAVGHLCRVIRKFII